MKTIYLDADHKCHIADDGTMTAVETDAFDRMCDAMIGCFRFVPFGESWTREDGHVFEGQMVTPWKDPREAEKAQREYERQLLSEYAEALKVLGVEV